eukprot:CAMPEP_0171186402 /NCGR_PEP_ID=MMETSP0790-20130122/16794_1 /TAXON_ID=2925 /ORGANISM="Alexandrium catenella, Strain OF101" /LENGTH=248 /DNA_ID=CAMNT_0011651445 /DNA_START=53 /DNA_END=799 /DNA_ORIENTATION=-
MAGLASAEQDRAQRAQALLSEARQHQQPTQAVDNFFASDPGLVTVFDFDYDLIIEFTKKLQWTQFVLLPPLWLSALACGPCFLNQNIEWTTRARHVALTVDGIRYVVDKHKTLCGLSCSDRGKESKTVPYDKITDCDVQEPAGTACCCCIQRVLSQVTVDTASSGNKDGVPRHELVLGGLRYPNEFKQAVWSMKRGEVPAATQVPMVPGAAGTYGACATAPTQDTMSTSLLTEIRDELHELNAYLRSK